MRAMPHGPARSRPALVPLLAALLVLSAMSAMSGLGSVAQAQTTTPVNQPDTVLPNQVSLSLPFVVYNDAATTGIQASFTCTTSGAINSCVPPSSMELPADGSGNPLPTTVHVRFNSFGPGSGTLVLNVTTSDGGGGCCVQRPARIPGTPPGPAASASDGMPLVMSLGMSMGTGSGSYLITVAYPPTYTVAVWPDSTPASADANYAGNTYPFTVQNTGNADATYALTCSNTMGACSLPPGVSSVFVPHGGMESVSVTYQAGAVGTQGTVGLTASYAGYSDAGSVTATAYTHTVSVTPKGDTLRPPAKQPSWTTGFSVDNTGTESASYTVSASCPGSATICNLSVAQNPLPVAAGQSGGVSVAFGTGPEPDTGSVHVVASYAGNPAVQDEGWVTWIARAMCGGSYSSFTPCDTTIVVTPGTDGQVSFTLRNTGEIGQIGYALSCPGASPATLATCQTPLSYLPIDQGQSSAVLLDYSAGSTQGEAEIRLLAQSGPGGEQQSALPWQAPASVGRMLGGPWSGAAEDAGLSVGVPFVTSDEQLGTSLHLQILEPTSVMASTDTTPIHVDASGHGSHDFQVHNAGPLTATYTLVSACTGVVVDCVPSPAQLTLDPGATASVSMSYSLSATAGTGAVGLRAEHALNGIIQSTATVSIIEDRVPPTVALDPYDGEYHNTALCAVSCFDATASYTTPSYTSLDVPRAVTLVYSSATASPRPVVQVDVTDPSAIQADTISLRLLDSDGNYQPLANDSTEVFFTNRHAAERLAVQFDPTTPLATGTYFYTVVVTSYWSSGVLETTYIPIHVLVVNAQTSPYGAGWSVAGLERMFFSRDAFGRDFAMITDGTGSAMLFSFASCTAGGCIYNSPDGDFTTLTSRASWPDNIKFDRRSPDGTTVSFTTDGREAYVEDRFGNRTTFGYDASNRLITITDPAGQSDTLHYNAAGTLDYIQDPMGRRTLVTVSSTTGDLTQIQDPAGGLPLRASYDSLHLLLSLTDRAGDSSNFGYDFAGKLAAVTLPAIMVNGQSTRPIVQYGSPEATMLANPSDGAGTSTNPAPGIDTSTVRGTVTDPGGHTTVFALDRWGQPLTVIEPLGRTTTITRSGIFAVRIVYPSGAKDSASYNSSGLLTYDAPAGRSATSITYGAYAEPTEISGANQPTWTFVYGSQGQDSLATVAGATTRYYADARGRDTLVVDPAGHTTHFHYEARFGNMDSTTADGGQTAVVRFDRYGRDSIRLASHQPTDTAIYDVLNRVVRLTSGATGGSTTFGYDSAGHLIRVADAEGQVYRVEVNALGWPTRRYDPADTLGRYISYGYNVDGLVTSWTNRRGQSMTQTYDALHRLIARDDGVAVADSFAYNAAGTRLVGWNAVSRDSVFTSPSGWTDSVVTYLKGHRFRRAYRPTTLQQLDSLEFLGPSTITFAGQRNFWNPATGLLDSVRVGGRRFAQQYNGEFLPDVTTYPSSATRERFSTTVHQSMALTFSAPSLDTLFTRRYAYDSLGRVTREYRPIENGTGQGRRTFGYDGAGRLTALELARTENDSTCTQGATPLDEYGYDCVATWFAYHANAYGYDRVGNLLADSDQTQSTVTAGTYIAGDRQTGWGDVSYTYDLDGHRASKTSGTTTVAYHWTADGRLDSVAVNGITLGYAYNAFGALVGRSVNGTVDAYFLWDRGQLLAELDSTAAGLVAQYAYWPGTDHPLELDVPGVGPQSYAQDALGSVIGLFDQTNTATAELSYDPWGIQTAGGGTTVAGVNRLRWKALLWAGDTTQLYYVRARWYDPQGRRFLSEDPLGLGGGINQYVYAGDDPINGWDPSGLAPDDPKCGDDASLYKPYCTAYLSEMLILGHGQYSANLVGAIYDDLRVPWGLQGTTEGIGLSGGGARGTGNKNSGSNSHDRLACVGAAANFIVTGAGDLAFFTGVGEAYDFARIAWTNRQLAKMFVRGAAREIAHRGLARGYAVAAGTTASLALAERYGAYGIKAEEAWLQPISFDWQDFVPGWASYRAFRGMLKACR